jgi:hypothetical protein
MCSLPIVSMKDERPDSIESLKGFAKASGFLRTRRSHGLIRPERSDSVYSIKGGRSFLSDTLPGYQGYKRVKIYTFG